MMNYIHYNMSLFVQHQVRTSKPTVWIEGSYRGAVIWTEQQCLEHPWRTKQNVCSTGTHHVSWSEKYQGGSRYSL